MSCVDSAIIKALVEHIGMNPDDVPVGGSSSDSNPIFLDATWSINDNDEFTFILPEGPRFGVGSVIKLIADDNSNTFIGYCVGESTSDEGILYDIRESGDLTSSFGVLLKDGAYRIEEFADTKLITPDNSTSGIYNMTISEVINILMQIVRRIH